MRVIKKYSSNWRILKGIKIFLLLLSLQVASAQDNLQNILNSFTDYRNNNIQEKIFVHTDKDYYQAGDIIWFKVYNTNAVDNKPSGISKITYIEVLDSARQQLLHGKIAMNESVGKGSFYIPPNVASGNYVLRAYTRWMKNFDPSFFFEKPITIINVKKLSSQPKLPAIANYKLNFYPEGGNILYGFLNKIAFKAIDGTGNPYDFKGYLLDNSDTLLHFEPYNEGMGSFVFEPKPGHVYKVIVQPKGGTGFTKQLPSIRTQGYTMMLNDDGQTINIKASTDIPGIKELFLIAHTRQSVKVSSKAILQNNTATFSFKRSDLGDGVSHITLFNEQRKPVSERLYYKEPGQLLDVKITTDLESYRPRGAVNISIASSNVDTASLSMSVYRLDSLQNVNWNNDIASYLYLASDLGGSVDGVHRYFLNKDKKASDNLLLTHGWRRFNWDKIIQKDKTFFEYAPEYSGHLVTGRVINNITNKPAGDIITYLSSPSYLTHFKTVGSNANGSIVAEIKNFFGGTHLIAQTNPLMDSIYRVEIDNPFSKKFSSTSIPSMPKLEKFPSTVLKQNIAMQVQNIYHGQLMDSVFYPPATDSFAFYGKPDFRYNLDNYVRFTTIEEILREYVPMVAVRRRNGEVHLPMIDTKVNMYFLNDPLTLLDGVPIFNQTKFFEFDPLKLNVLEIVAQRYVYGKNLFDGILNWKTYKPSLSNYSLEPNAIVMDYPGLQMEREFYSPDYNNELQQRSRVPDFRNVLKWSPAIVMTKGNVYSENFFTSDIKGKYVIIVQALDQSGLPGSAVKYFEVK